MIFLHVIIRNNKNIIFFWFGFIIDEFINICYNKEKDLFGKIEFNNLIIQKRLASCKRIFSGGGDTHGADSLIQYKIYRNVKNRLIQAQANACKPQILRIHISETHLF